MNRIRSAVAPLCVIVALGGCAATGPTPKSNFMAIQRLAQRQRRDEMAILEVNRKVDEIGRLVSGPPHGGPVKQKSDGRKNPALLASEIESLRDKYSRLMRQIGLLRRKVEIADRAIASFKTGGKAPARHQR